MSETQDHVLHVFMNRDYPSIVKTEGIYLYDDQGRRYLDASGGPILCNLGYGRSDVVEAVSRQAEQAAFVYRLDFSTPILQKAAAEVCRVSDGLLDKVFFVSGGSEATEIAVKLARCFHIDNGQPGRYKVISRWLSYHGMTNGALALSGHPARRAPYEAYLKDFAHIPPAYCYRCWFGRTPDTCNLECAQALENEILCQNPGSVAAFIAEPLSGMSLCAAHPRPEYFSLIREICDRYGVLLIWDEVMTGFGRTGRWFAYQHFAAEPDIIALGKGLGGGYFPIGAAAATARVADTMAQSSGVFLAGFSWAGNPMAAAACAKTVEILEAENLISRSAEMGGYLFDKLEDLMTHPTVGEVRGKGLMVGVEFVKDKQTKEPLDPGLYFYRQLAEIALKRGLFLEAGSSSDRGRAGDMVLFGPPFIVTRTEIDEMVGLLEESLTVLEAKLGY